MLTKELRPTEWNEVFGNRASVKVLRNALEEGSIRCFLFEGPAGVGKTTLARIAASSLECAPHNVEEINCAVTRGVDDWIEIVAGVKFNPMGGRLKVYIVDECQEITTQAWTTLLKTLEDTQDHVYWFFCTTKGFKDFPKTIQSRLMAITLHAPSTKELTDFVKSVCSSQGITLSKAVTSAVVSAGDYSYRQTLMRLDGVRGLSSEEDQLEYLGAATDDEKTIPVEIFELCKALLNTAQESLVPTALATLKHLSEGNKNPESIRQIVLAYFTTTCLGQKYGTPKYERCINVLNAFSIPWPPLTIKLVGPIMSIDMLGARRE
jgi:DNA polymerase III gamma/tau subunit